MTTVTVTIPTVVTVTPPLGGSRRHSGAIENHKKSSAPYIKPVERRRFFPRPSLASTRLTLHHPASAVRRSAPPPSVPRKALDINSFHPRRSRVLRVSTCYPSRARPTVSRARARARAAGYSTWFNRRKKEITVQNNRDGLSEAEAWWRARPRHRLMRAPRLSEAELADLSELARVSLFNARRALAPDSEAKRARRDETLRRLKEKEKRTGRERLTLGEAARPMPQFRTKRRRP